MLAGIIAYQVLQQENPPTIEKVNAILEKHPWYANQWHVRLQDIPVADHSLMLFMRVVVSSGDIHQPLHTAQIFNVDYPNGDRGGNEICIRVTQTGQPMDLHRFWDGVITSSSNLTRLRNEATALPVAARCPQQLW